MVSPSTPRIDIKTLQHIVEIDPYFGETAHLQFLVFQLEEGLKLDRLVYPAAILRPHLQHLFSDVKKSTSTICRGDGLSATSPIPAKRLVGIYGGSLTTDNNPYAVCLVSGTACGQKPVATDPWTHYGYINDYLHTVAGNNCELRNLGLIFSNRPVEDGDELLMAYGNDYQYWGDTKIRKHFDLQQALLSFSHDLPTSPRPTAIESAFLRARSNPDYYTGFHELLRDFFYYEGFDSSQASPADRRLLLHDFLPVYHDGEDVYIWIESVLRCRWFFDQNFFRRLNDPNHDRRNFFITPSASEVRSSSSNMKLRAKTRVLYSNAAYEEDEDSEYSEQPTLSHKRKTPSKPPSRSVIAPQTTVSSSASTTDFALQTQSPDLYFVPMYQEVGLSPPTIIRPPTPDSSDPDQDSDTDSSHYSSLPPTARLFSRRPDTNPYYYY